MRLLAIALAFAANLALAQAPEAAFQGLFVDAMQALQAGDAERAERLFRDILARTDSPRVKLELARALYLQGRLKEAKTLFDEVAALSDTPWRVRDNIAPFVRDIEERTGYLKVGFSLVSDSNPRSIARQEEFTIGGIRVTPTEAPQEEAGLRYSLRGWWPFDESGRHAAYLSAAYNDFSGQELDRLTLDVGAMSWLGATGRLRGKAGIEAGTFGGSRLYDFPYVALEAVLAEAPAWRFAGEAKLGRVRFNDYAYLNADFLSSALSLHRALAQTAAGTLRASVELSRAAEDPYSYDGLELASGLHVLWPASAYTLGASATYGEREYAAADPLFGQVRADTKLRLELTLGNRNWHLRDKHVALVAAVEENHSSIEFYAYRKANLTVVVD